MCLAIPAKVTALEEGEMAVVALEGVKKRISVALLDEVALGDRTSMVFAGTGITRGSARAVVVATGTSTETGRIADLLEATEQSRTPLQRQIATLSKMLGIAVLVIAAIVIAAVLANAYRYLQPGGTIRIAVPDGHNPDPDYIRHVEPGGIGPGADDHKQLFTVESLSAALAAAGFTVEPREWFDTGGAFHEEPWIAERGHVHRCRRFGTPDKSFPSSHLSLLVDGIKA